jgi:hypothetical protein
MTPPTPAAARRPRRREQDIQREVLKLLHARGVAAWPMNRESGVRRALGNERIAARIGGPGFADIIGILPIRVVRRQIGTMGTNDDLLNGRFFALELKAPKARTEKRRALAQAAFGAVVTRAGGIYLRIDPKAAATACEQICAAFGWHVEGKIHDRPKETPCPTSR